MKISNRCAEGLLWLYKNVNRTGLMDSKWVRAFYVKSYFTYKKYLEDSYAKLIKHHSYFFKGGNILDVGANIGYTAFVFSKVLENPFKILAFEPEKRNLEILKDASQRYCFSDKLISVAAAVGDQEGEIELWRNEAHNGDHRILTEELKNQLKGNIQIQKTPIVTIDSYLKKQTQSFPISFIKIDVQGYELAVCRGMQETLTRNPKAVISFEYCPSIIESLGFKPNDLLAFFQERNYQCLILNNQNRIEPYDVEKDNIRLRKIRPHDYIDILCVNKSTS